MKQATTTHTFQKTTNSAKNLSVDLDHQRGHFFLPLPLAALLRLRRVGDGLQRRVVVGHGRREAPEIPRRLDAMLGADKQRPVDKVTQAEGLGPPGAQALDDKSGVGHQVLVGHRQATNHQRGHAPVGLALRRRKKFKKQVFREIAQKRKLQGTIEFFIFLQQKFFTGGKSMTLILNPVSVFPSHVR